MRVSYGNSRKAKKWKNGDISIDELRNRLQNAFRTPETVLEYAKLRGEARSDAKDKGGFVGGHLKGGIRSKSTVEFRSMLTLDVDNASLTFLDEYESLCPYHTFIYSTHSHTPAAPRYRLVVFLTRDITPDEYQAITRLYCAEWGIDLFDPCSFLPSQLMFWPTTPKDGEYIFREVNGEALDPDVFLAKYPLWKDPSSLPVGSKEKDLVKKQQKKAENPLDKEGIVGAFCKAYTIEDAIEKFLSDVYEPAEAGKYHYKSSSSAAGLVVYDHKLAYSHHATDPAYGLECNAFDLVRTHLFPEEDAKKSFQKMADFASQQPEVGRVLLKQKQEAAEKEFSDESEEADWTDSLERDRTGNVKNTLQNLVLIMENDKEMKKIRFNQLADGMEADADIDWSENRQSPFWRDADDAQLIYYVDSHYGTFSQRNYDIAVTKVVDDRSYHPIKLYLESLPAWDKKPRVDRLLIDYLGAEDTPYVRTVTRKTLCAAVTRVYHPGTKFDYMPVLNGDQGIGKSTLIAKLGMDWFSDSLTLGDMNDKTAAEKLQGYWIHEIGELAGMKKADIDKVKAFISRQGRFCILGG